MTLIELIGLLQVAAQPGERELTAEDSLLANGLVEKLEAESGPPAFGLTERGDVFVRYLLALPLPEMAWRMPGQHQHVMPVIERASSGGKGPAFGLSRATPQASPPAPTFVIPTDPAELETLATRLLDNGFGLQEVKDRLNLTEAQAQAFFHGSG